MTVAETPEGVAIRRVNPSDLRAIRRIEREVFPQPWPEQAFRRFVDEPGFLVAVADAPGRSDDAAPRDDVVGYVVADVVSSYGTDLGHVKDLAVASGYRRRGVGAALLGRALSVLAGGGVRSVKLEVREGNDAARGLYDRFGFRLRRRLPHYYADGEDALVFVTEVERETAGG